MTRPVTDPLSIACADALLRLWPRLYRDVTPDDALAWIERAVRSSPAGWRSLVSDDHTPVELSVACGPEGETLRLLVEAQADEPTTAAQMAAALSVQRWACDRLGARGERLDAIAPWLLPDAHRGRFALWHAAVFRPDGAIDLKAYLDPAARGASRAAETVERSLEALGLLRAWPAVASLAGRGPSLDRLSFFSIDLVEPTRARTKVYVSKHRASVAELRAAARLARHGDEDALLAHLEATVGAREGYLPASLPIVTCLDFVADDPTPQHLTVHVPVRAYAPHDAEAMSRARAALRAAGLAPRPAEEAVAGFARRELDAGSGMIPYVSHRSEAAGRRVTVYLSLEAARIDAPHAGVAAAVERPSSAGPIAPLVEALASAPITHHPFLQRLAREPLAMERLALVLLNFQAAITRDFARRLAQTVARVDDEAVRSILAKQLDDELGHGDPDAAHRLLFDRFVEGLHDHVPDPLPEGHLAPGQRLAETLEHLYVREPNGWVGVGATLVMEVFGQQVDAFLGEQFRRQSELPASVLEWLTQHEELEHDHVEEVFTLARRIPEGDARARAREGVEALATAGWAFFDDLYRVVWPS